jgi:CBS domain containing-hemolysin-like protein
VESYLYLAIVFLILSASMALMSHALRRYSMVELETLFSAAGRQSEVEPFLAREESLLTTVNVWRLLSNLGIGVSMALYLCDRTNALEIVLLSLVTAAIVLAVAVAVPMAWARYASGRILVRSLPLLLTLRAVTVPLLGFVGVLGTAVRRLAGVVTQADPEQEYQSELLSVVKEGALGGAFEEEATEMIEGIIELKNANVSQIMTPRTDMICVPQKASLAQVRRLIVEEGHSRVPAYQDNPDSIVGVLYAKDLLAATDQPDFTSRTVADIMRPVLYIPEVKRVTDMLRDFRREGVHIAIVLDEYGGTAGLVTIEDVIEEIVGEIGDEYDQAEPEGIRRVDPGTAEVDAQEHISEINDALGTRLPDEEDYDTIAGFVLSRLGAIPEPGVSLEYNGLTLTVLDADARRVRRVRITGLDQPPAPDGQ